MQSSSTIVIKQLKASYPTISEDKIARIYKRFDGDLKKIEEKLKFKTKKTQEVITKYNLKSDDIQSLCQQFSELRLNDIIKGIEATNGNIVEAKAALEAKNGTEGKKGHYKHHRKHEKVEEKLDVDVAALVGEYAKLYPNVPEEKVRRIAERSCSKLKKIEKRLLEKETKKGKCSSSSSSRSRSRKPRRGKCEVARPSDFAQLLSALKTQFPDIEEKRLSKILQRNRFDLNKAIEKINHRMQHRRNRESKEDELFLKEIPSTVSKVIVDGNNLLFVNELIRGLTIRSGMTKGTEALSKLISAYNAVESRNILVVYDDFHGKVAVENIQIDVARPKFKTSDDYLVNLSESMTTEIKDGALFVTSDVGLQERLKKNGVKNIMKSGKFVKLCESKVPNLGDLLQKK